MGDVARETGPPLRGTAHALWRSLRFAYRAEPRLLVLSFVLVTTAFVPDALGALWLKFLAQGITQHRGGLVAGAAVGLAGSGAVGWALRITGDRVHFLFRERATIAIESHVARLQGSVASIEHHERPEYLDRLQILKDQAFLLNHLYFALMGTVGSIAQLGITAALLVTVQPALAVLLVFAAPKVLVSARRAGALRRAEEAAAPHRRLALHAFTTATTAGPGKEVRVSRTQGKLVELRDEAWTRWYRTIAAVRWANAAWHAAAWALFAAAYVGGIVVVADGGRGAPGNVLLVVAAGANLTRYLAATAGEADFLSWTLDAAKRLAWLEDYAAAHDEHADAPVPGRLRDGIVLEDVSFTYPGTGATVLRDVHLHIPAGSVVAIVGENGAGKSTLVKCQ